MIMLKVRNKQNAGVLHVRQEVFQSSILRRIILPAFIATVMLVLFIIENGIPTLFLILFIIPVGIFTYEHRSKIIIEDGTLIYQHGFIVLKKNEAVLKEVMQIVLRQIETWEEDSDGVTKRVTKKIIYVLDNRGEAFYSFSAHLIVKKHIKNFEEAVNAINPNINVDLN